MILIYHIKNFIKYIFLFENLVKKIYDYNFFYKKIIYFMQIIYKDNTILIITIWEEILDVINAEKILSNLHI
jgi:hypothetical protein